MPDIMPADPAKLLQSMGQGQLEFSGYVVLFKHKQINSFPLLSFLEKTVLFTLKLHRKYAWDSHLGWKILI